VIPIGITTVVGNPSELGAAIRAQRMALKITQEELAGIIGG